MVSNEVIRKNNDAFREKFLSPTRSSGMVVLTHGVDVLPIEDKREVLNAVIKFNAFTEDNDPYGEHDFGKVVVKGVGYFWKFDYFDSDKYEYGFNFNDADEDRAYRVLTIMRCNEY